jgi:hypothetical protein
VKGRFRPARETGGANDAPPKCNRDSLGDNGERLALDRPPDPVVEMKQTVSRRTRKGTRPKPGAVSMSNSMTASSVRPQDR